MIFKIFILGLLLTTSLVSCKNSQEETNSENSEIKPEVTSEEEELEKEVSSIDSEAIVKSLQGNWKEPEYPFNVIQFRDNQVKLIEEGVAEEPVFQEYKILNECPFDVNNIKNVEPDDIIFVLVERRTCDKLRISSDSLTLSGYSAHTGEEYNILYKKVE